MISIDNLSVSFGGWSLFDQISFLINPKDRIGLVGKNGAGKTTLFKAMLGALRPTEGRVLLGGKTPQEFTQKYFKQVAVVFQDNIAFNKFTVTDQMNLMNIVMEEHKSSDDLLKMLE